MPLVRAGDVALLRRVEERHPRHLVMALGAVRRLELLQKKRLTEGLPLNEASWPVSRSTLVGPLDRERNYFRKAKEPEGGSSAPSPPRCQEVPHRCVAITS